MHFAALRIQARHYMLDQAILARCIYTLQDNQHGPLALGVQLAMQFTHFGDALVQQLLDVLFGMEMSRIGRIKVF